MSLLNPSCPRSRWSTCLAGWSRRIEAGDEPVTDVRQRFNESGLSCVVGKSVSQAVDGTVDAVIEFEKAKGRPQAEAQFFSRHNLARAFEKCDKNVKRLLSEGNSDTVFPQFPCARVGFVCAEAIYARD